METFALTLLQIGLGTIAVVVAIAGGVWPRAALVFVPASFAIALAPIIITIELFRQVAEVGDTHIILDTAGAYVICSVALGIVVIGLGIAAIARALRRG